MATVGRFSSETVDTLSKRAALTCSNPDCGALTAGPTVSDVGSVNIGEAAHIFGLTPRSARYTSSLSAAELSDITNGIWLCRNCHKSIDNDELRFPVDLLFQWRRLHEAVVLDQLGKPGERLREKIKSDRLEKFTNTSYLAQQIILDRPDCWEYKLTLEVLRNELRPIAARWDQLKRGMYVRPAVLLPAENILNWLTAKMHDNSKMVQAMHPLLAELMKSWGDPGVPGNEEHIIEVSRLIGGIAARLLEWEEEVHFCYAPEKYREMVEMFRGLGGSHLSEILRIPSEIATLFEEQELPSYRHVSLVFKVPDDFVKKFEVTLQRATA